MADNPKTILYAEDSAEDFWFLNRSFRRAGLSHTLLRVEDGREAIAYLKGEGKYAERTQHPIPDVMLLDIKLPFFTGLEVLEYLRSQPEFFDLPVVMLSSSDQPRDRERARELRADWYFVKPFTLADYENLARTMNQAWIERSPLS